MEQFQFGDPVHWTSKQEAGPPIERQGIVVAVVPPGGDPFEFVPKGYSTTNIDNSRRKDHESYIVMVGKKAFWPAVGRLKRGLAEED